MRHLSIRQFYELAQALAAVPPSHSDHLEGLLDGYEAGEISSEELLELVRELGERLH